MNIANQKAQRMLLASAFFSTGRLRSTATTQKTTDIHGDPLTLETALSGANGDKWKEAVKAEYMSLLENGTFEAFRGPFLPGSKDTKNPIKIPFDANLIGCKWVFKTKVNPDNTIRFKARLVIKGYQQVEGLDFTETYAPVSKMATFRMLLSHCSKASWSLDHLDVVTAFLNPKVDRDDIYM